MQTRSIFIPFECMNIRLDKFLADNNTSLTRSQIQKFIEAGQVTICGKQVKAGYRLKGGEDILMNFEDTPPLKIAPEPIDLDIVYEDDSIVVVNKSMGMVVHPAAGNWSGTLVNALLCHCSRLSEMGGSDRPGIVHRLDKDTTGLLVVAKDDYSHANLSNQLQDRSMFRIYMAIVMKEMRTLTGEISSSIGRHPTNRKKMAIRSSGGKEAVTFYKVLKRFKEYSLLELKLKTGRTHQIRVHLASIGHPVIGDRVYGLQKGWNRIIGRQALHAAALEFCHPKTGERLKFTAPLPSDFEEALSMLEQKI